MTVDGVQYASQRYACYDRGYIDVIIESSQWAIAHSLVNLFVTLLTSNSLCMLEIIWNTILEHLSNDVQYNLRLHTDNPSNLLYV